MEVVSQDVSVSLNFYTSQIHSSPLSPTLAQICDHNLVVNFFVESLNSERLWGGRCGNLAEMEANRCTGAGSPMGGEPSNSRNNLNGIFRMPTNANSPFGVGQF